MAGLVCQYFQSVLFFFSVVQNLKQNCDVFSFFPLDPVASEFDECRQRLIDHMFEISQVCILSLQSLKTPLSSVLISLTPSSVLPSRPSLDCFQSLESTKLTANSFFTTPEFFPIQNPDGLYLLFSAAL